MNIEYFVQMDSGTGKPAASDLLYIAVKNNMVFAEYDNNNKKWQMCPPYEKDRGEGINNAGSLYWQKTNDAPSMTKKKPQPDNSFEMKELPSAQLSIEAGGLMTMPLEKLISLKLQVEEELQKRLESKEIKELLKVINK